MNIEDKKRIVRQQLNVNKGILRLAPTWVPRSFLLPGGRLKLHPRDLYALGAHRGGIDERWLASTTNAENGPLTADDEGLSYIVIEDSGSPIKKVLLRDAIELLGDEILGSEVMNQHHGWAVLTKLFDNKGSIPYHMHQMEEHAKNVGRRSKPEAYYFPVQLNTSKNLFPYTYFGVEPGTTKEDIIRCLERWDEGDNGILDYSKAYRLKPGTGWDIPAGVLHSPGSLVTYEPQGPSDVFGMFQSLIEDRVVPRELLVKDVPENKQHDLDYIISMLDWDLNVDPQFKKNRFREPKPVKPNELMKEEGYIENWVVYGSNHFLSKELTIFPGRTVVIKDDAAYGLYMLAGNGMIQGCPLETPTIIRFEEHTYDEYFVTASAAHNGVVIVNRSQSESIVLLKHFGPLLQK